jgi:hypothetical protein
LARPGRAWPGKAGVAGRGKAWRGKAGVTGFTTHLQEITVSKKRKQDDEFEFREGARYQVSADAIGRELGRIYKRDQVITAPVVVAESRPDDAPLHGVFEWEDEVAGEKYRIWQARHMIRSVRIITEDDQGEKHSEPAYTHVKIEPAGYHPVSVVVSHPDLYADALSSLARKVAAAETALRELQDAAEKTGNADHERMARIAIAVQAMQTASEAVRALH